MSKLSQIFAAATACFVLANIAPILALKAGYKDLHVYDYKAEISVGVEEPANYKSKYSVHGLLKVQRDVDQVSVSQYKYLIALTDVKYHSYYGEDAIRISKYEAVDEKVLGNAFTAFYKPSGQLKSTVFDKNESSWSKNIKQSIASLLQFDWSSVQNDVKKEGQAHTASVEEDTIHGKCFVNYNTTLTKYISKTEKKINLVKTTNPIKCNKFVNNYNGYGISDEASIIAIKNRMNHKKTKIESVFELDVNQNEPIVKKIFQFESYCYDYDFEEFQLNRNSIFVKVRQTLFLTKTEPGHEFLHKSENIASTRNNSDVLVSQKEIVNKVKDILLEISQYMKENRLVEIKPGTEHRQLFNRIHHYMKDLDTDSYEFLYSDIRNMKVPETEALRRLFIQITPYIGTKSSLTFIKNMLMTKKVSDSDAIGLISDLSYVENADKVLPDLEVFLNKDNGLSPEVHQKAIISFSYLIGKVCRNNYKFSSSVLNKYIQSIDVLIKDATTIEAKLAFLTALGNTQCHAAKKYIKALLPRQKSDSNDKVRLRMLATFILTRLIDEDDTDVLKELSKILYDNNETTELRMEAYKILVHKSDFETEDFIKIGRSISNVQKLYDYHLTTMRIFNKIGILTNDALSKMEPKKDTLMPLMLGNVVMEFNDLIDKKMNFEIVKRFFKRELSKNTLLRVAYLRQPDLKFSLEAAPSLFELEIFHLVDEKITVDRAIYVYSNLADVKNDGDNYFIDLVCMNDGHFTVKSLNIPKIDKDTWTFDKLLKFLTDTIGKSLNKSWLPYYNLESFSIPIGFGINAVYERKQPMYINSSISYDIAMAMDSVKAQIKFFFDYSAHGYSDVSVENPLSQLRHSARKTRIYDTTLSGNAVVKSELSRNFEISIPLISTGSQLKKVKGFSYYTSSSVMTTDRYGETDCSNCGYQDTTKPDSVKSNKRLDDSSLNFIGLTLDQITYNCDLPRKINRNIASSCGKLQLIEADSSKSQIELKIDYDYKKLLNTSSPWYYLPGVKLHLESTLGTRMVTSNKLNQLLKLDFDISSSQGRFKNSLQFKTVKRTDEKSNFVICFDGTAAFPKIDDNHLTNKITPLNFNSIAKLQMGQSKGEYCSALNYTVDFDLTGELLKTQKFVLEQYASVSRCRLDTVKWLYIYLNEGSYLLTDACIREMISNATLRHYTLNMNSEQILDPLILQPVLTIKKWLCKWKELAVNSRYDNVKAMMTTMIPDIVLEKRMSFIADFPISHNDESMPNIYGFLPNIYFPQELILDFVDNKITVVNVFPEYTFYKNVEQKLVRSKDWTEIYTGVEKAPYQIYAIVIEQKKLKIMSFKIVYKDSELILKPKSVSTGESEENCLPEIYFNQQLFRDFEQRLHLFSSEKIIFSLSKVDHYVVIRSPEIPVTIYYTAKLIDSGITIFQRM